MSAIKIFTHLLHRASIICGMLLIFSMHANGQVFSSGSTGADGALNPSASTTIQLPASGVLNFTTINIPAGVTVTFVRNAGNTPVVLLATGDVTIAGAISVAGEKGKATGAGGLGGPGGGDGGAGAPGGCKTPNASNPTLCAVCECKDMMCGQPGGGPGGGAGGNMGISISAAGSAGGGGAHITNGQTSAINNGAAGAIGGTAYGSDLMLPLTGGSGGGGASGRCEDRLGGGGGGGGGGAIVIASSTKIILNGSVGGDFDFPAVIDASGGGAENNFRPTGGSGGGGAVRLIANEITGSGGIKAGGGIPDAGGFNVGGRGANGVIRLECHKLTVGSLRTDIQVITHSIPRPVSSTQIPVIAIATVAGIVPVNPPRGALNAAADVSLPASQANPVVINLTTSGIPLGSTIKVTVTPSGGDPLTATSGPVTGTINAGTATVNVNLPAGQSIIKVTPLLP